MNAAFRKTATSRADLVRLIAALPPDRVARAAGSLGYEAPEELEVASEERAAPEEFAAGPQKTAGKLAEVATKPAASMPFWRLETMTFNDEPDKDVSRPNPQGQLTDDDFTSPGRSLLAIPQAPPLAPWSRLWPTLRGALQSSIPGREPDVAAYVRAVCHGEIVTRIPRLTRQTWSGRVSIWIDRSARLVPFWSDQADVSQRLQKVCDRSGIDVRLLDARTQTWSINKRGDLLAGFRAHPGTPILVLGDLGIFGADVDRAAWRRTGKRLHRDDIRLSALVPCPPARWDSSVARLWNAVPWERGRLRRVLGISRETSVWQRRAERLLKLCSPAALVQPSLLRALRLLLPASQADASTEADVWNHADVRAADATGWVLQPEAAERWRKAFTADVDFALKKRVSETIGAWHEKMPRELLRAETLVWHALVPNVDTPGPLQDALDFAARLEGSVLASGDDPRFAAVVKRYGRTLLAGMPEAIYEKLPALQTVWVASFDGAAVPAGIDPVAIRAKLERPAGERYWSVRQVGGQLVFSPNERGGEWPSYVEGPGSPMAWLLAARPWMAVVRGKRVTTHRLQNGLCIPLEPEQGLEVRTDRSTIRLEPWRRESWAVAAGRDRYGLWADADIKGVVQRFRWIPPGRFLMGSPEDEVGHNQWEEPQHLVTWTTGRWFGDTPVTQALWRAVMRKNPSSLHTDDRPVEQVSWYECTAFANMLAKLGARLPTEAEWEHACRAGTTTATWLGDLVIQGEYDAPLIDSTAWYGGNCDVQYDLNTGYDTTDWHEKQHNHIKRGSQPVGRKQPNPLGLYDMLGNVYEWCNNIYKWYSNDNIIDPSIIEEGSNSRALRGGGWISTAQEIRSANRRAGNPRSRGEVVGFRLVLGPAPGKDKP